MKIGLHYLIKQTKERCYPLNFWFSYFVLFALFMGSTFRSTAQDTSSIQVRARVQQDAILLRWAAATPMAWKQTNRYGFKLERYTVVRNGQILPQAELKEFPSVKAKALNEWEPIVQQDNYAAIIAQALYGDDFELSGGEASGIAKIISLSQELEQRFSLSLYAADQSFDAAVMAGWGWKDTDVRPGERYLYRVTALLAEDSKLNIEMGSAYVSLDQYEALPQPIGLSSMFGDKSVMLAWDYSILSDTYNSYFIEKSTDGKNFTRLEGLPVTNLNNTEQASQRMYFMDSLARNNVPFYYRICGTTAFGEVGPPSGVVQGEGKTSLTYVPQITGSMVNDQGSLNLEWEFDERGNSLIKGFVLNQSGVSNKDFVPVVQDIPPTTRSLNYAKLDASNYFTITAIGFDGRTSESFPILVQPLDTVPPAIPKGLQGRVDSMGVVTLTWNKNTETDLLGYKLYRGFTKNEERMPLFDIALQDTVYRDTVNVHNLNSKVYYSLSAADKRYNQSNQSTPVELEKPDFIRPSSPMISGYKITDTGIEISWINSPDEGVNQHRIYRREKEGFQSTWLLSTIMDTSVHTFTDTTVVAGVRYSYTVTALKHNWLESPHSPAVGLFSNKVKKQVQSIDRFDAVVDKENRMIKLLWKDKLTDVIQYELYKSEDGQPLSLWKIVPQGLYEVLDEGMYINARYQYMIRALLKNGSTSTKSLTINY